MKKRYKKPNICAIDFDILDLIHTSGGVGPVNPDDDYDWEDDFSKGGSRGKKSNGGFDGIGWY